MTKDLSITKDRDIASIHSPSDINMKQMANAQSRRIINISANSPNKTPNKSPLKSIEPAMIASLNLEDKQSTVLINVKSGEVKAEHNLTE